jgi:fibronectin-binding autotransporter adhesin
VTIVVTFCFAFPLLNSTSLMNSSTPRARLRALAAFAASAPLVLSAATATWDGNGTANSGGNFSTAVNWDTDTVPISGDTAIFGDVTTGNRTVVYDSTSGGLATLQFNQTTASSVNTLDIQKNLTVANAITLGATGGTEIISFNTGFTPTTSISLTATSGITLNSGGQLHLAAFNSGTAFFSNVTGNVTIAGGTLNVRASDGTTTSSSLTNTITGSLTMSSGSIIINNATGTGDRRLAVTGNLNITGGSVSNTLTSPNGTLFLTGGTNVFNPTSFDTRASITLGSSGTQSFTTNQTLGSLILRGTGVKTVTAANVGTSVDGIVLIDGDSTANSATTLKLGANITLNANAKQIAAANFSQTTDSVTANRTDFAIDTNGFTYDGSAGASSGVWTPNIGATGNLPVWTITGSGTIKANAFNFNTANVTTNVGTGTTLLAVGAGGTTSTLSGTGTINAGSIFRYAGTGTLSSAALLVSSRSIGALQVNSGVLRVNSALTAASITVASGATFGGTGTLGGDLSVNGMIDPGNNTVGTMTFSNNATFNSGASVRFELGANTAASDQLSIGGNLNFAGSTTFNLVNVAVPGSGGVYTLFSVVGTTTGIGSATATLAGYDVVLAQVGNNVVATLTASAIPEPSTYAALMGVAVLTGVISRRRRAVSLAS